MLRVNAAPVLVDDEATRAINDDGSVANAAAGGGSLPRAMRPDDLTGAAQWFVSDTSPFVSGQTVAVDGGRVAV